MKNNYFKNVVQRHLSELAENIYTSKNEREKNFYTNRYDVQLKHYAVALNTTEEELLKKLMKGA